MEDRDAPNPRGGGRGPIPCVSVARLRPYPYTARSPWRRRTAEIGCFDDAILGSSLSPAMRSATIRAGRPHGAVPSRSSPTTSSSWAAAGPRARDRVLPRGAARYQGRRGAREGLAGRREHRPQHHHHPASNYLWDESAHLYEHSLKLYEGLSRGAQLQHHAEPARGAQPRAQPPRPARAVAAGQRDPVERHRFGSAHSRRQIKAMVPILDTSPDVRYRCWAHRSSAAAGVARHDAVAWGFARGADARGVDIIQNCEVTGIRQRNGAVEGVETSRGYIRAGKVGVVVAGHAGVLAAMAGFRLPDREPSVAGAGVEPIQADPPLGGDVERGPTSTSASPTRASW